MTKFDELYRQTAKTLSLYLIFVLATRYLGGVAIGAIIILALFKALRKRVADAIALYALILLLIEINPNIVSLSTLGAGSALRFGLLIVGFALAISGSGRSGIHRIPMGMMLLYLGVSAISSISGFCPMVSYLKIINFFVFFSSIWIGTQNLSFSHGEILRLRATFLTISIFIIIGSLLLMPFPGISTLNGLQYNYNYGVKLTQEEINAILKETMSEDMTLFCGITHQSQVLGPMAPCLLAWVLCDMLFIEKRIRYLHMALIVSAIPIIYMTRSRVGLLTLFTALTLILLYLPKKITLPIRAQLWTRKIAALGTVALVMLAVGAEVKDHAITRWIRKTDDVRANDDTLVGAFTNSRMGKVEENLDYFKLNPLLGKGFQVNWESDRYNTGGLILSAPIEKGVAPLMILGETGVIGSLIFIAFLFTFYAGCSARKLYVTAVFFTIMFATNMGEATIFSPGGLGGELWMICVVGGFAMDTVIAAKRYEEARSRSVFYYG